MTETKPPLPASHVSRWARDAHSGRISAIDAHGDVLMTIGTHPMFGPRLAAAFSSPALLAPLAGAAAV